ncbi:hypothetical protein [Flavobacterium sp. '19STA2R22 D10 B1']|uniref:hypothetical protein n=1 Tax=Flavobacterium aerium TaxID=3037261 RepID=UPI00278BBA09|nr:hypothetical protein [Flavobacterium sp. '19STA2R22 D10 B1']
MKKKDDTTTLYLGINYFDRDKNHRWEQKEIEDFLIKSNIGLVIGNDTLIVKLCKY